MLQMSSGDLPILIYEISVDGCSDNQFQLLGNFLQGKYYYSTAEAILHFIAC